MPKGSIRNPGTLKTAVKRVPRADANEYSRVNSPMGKQRVAKVVNTWNEYRAAGTDTAGHATKSLRRSMVDVRSDKSAKRGTPTINKFRKNTKKK